MLDVEGIQTYYGDSHVLHDVSLRGGPGEAVALLGRNGAGKTTLIRSIVGFTPPRTGRVRFEGEAIDRWPAHRIARRGLALVPQGRRIFAPLTVCENLSIGARGSGWTPSPSCRHWPSSSPGPRSSRLSRPGCAPRRPRTPEMGSGQADGSPAGGADGAPAGEKLQKVLAARGVASRRVVEEMIAAGRVTVNGAVAARGARVDRDHDLIELDGALVSVRPGLVTTC